MNSGISMGLVWLDNKIANMMEKRRKNKETRPSVLRPDCSFHGFSLRGKLMTDSKGNQCALKTESYAPCQIEMAGDKPNWYKCPLKTEENKKRIEEGDLKEVRVFPREYRPAKGKWNGFPLKIWMRHIEYLAKE